MNHNSASFSSPVLTAVLLYEPPLVPVVLFPVFPVSPSGVAFSFFGLPVGEGVGVEDENRHAPSPYGRTQYQELLKAKNHEKHTFNPFVYPVCRLGLTRASVSFGSSDYQS